MNSKGQVIIAYLFIAFLIVLTLFALIEPLKDNLNGSRDSDSLNCPGVSGFNQTAYSNQNTFERIVYRPTCFVTGVSMVWFVGAVLIYLGLWILKNKR